MTFSWYITLSVPSCAEDNTEILYEILCQWVTGKYPSAVPATLNNLKRELASDLVGLRRMALDLDREFREAKNPQALIPAASTPYLDSTLKVVYQSCDAEVADGMSTLLEVQVSPNESASY